MPHTAVPAAELSARLSRLRQALCAQAPDWSMVILDHKINLYYLTGTMQDGALVITPDEAVFFVRRSYECAKEDSLFPDLRPMGSFRTIAEAFPHIPETVYVETRTMTLQKLSMLQKYLPFARTKSVDSVLSGLRATKSEYELTCMRTAGQMHAAVLERIVPSLVRRDVSEARLCGEICTALLEHGAMGISRFNQPMAEDVLGVCSFGAHGLCSAALDSPSGTVGTCIAMKSIGSCERRLAVDELILLDIPSGFRGYHTDKSMTYFYGDLSRHPQGALIRAAHDQCVLVERCAAQRMVPGAVPSEIYAELTAMIDPAFREGFMNGAKFLGHSIGLTMDETPVLARGFDAPLAAGMTFAVEPKIALPGIGLIGTENTYEICVSGPAQSLTGTPDADWEIND